MVRARCYVRTAGGGSKEAAEGRRSGGCWLRSGPGQRVSVDPGETGWGEARLIVPGKAKDSLDWEHRSPDFIENVLTPNIVIGDTPQRPLVSGCHKCVIGRALWWEMNTTDLLV